MPLGGRPTAAALPIFLSVPAIFAKCPPYLSWHVAVDETEIPGDRIRSIFSYVDLFSELWRCLCWDRHLLGSTSPWDRPERIKSRHTVPFSALEPCLSWLLYNCHVHATTTLIKHALLPVWSGRMVRRPCLDLEFTLDHDYGPYESLRASAGGDISGFLP